MMGRSHATSGALTGILTAPLLGLTTLSQVTPFALVVAGFALLPDLDHPSSTVSRSIGPVTEIVSALLRGASRLLYAITKGPRDEDCAGTHRHLTHTVLFALGLGIAAGLIGEAHPWAVLGVAAFGVFLGSLALGGWMIAAGAVTGALWLFSVHGDLAAAEAGLAGVTWKIGIAVGLGCFVHCVGDSLTQMGCPWAFPTPIAGETWYEIKLLPPGFRLHTDGLVENLIILPGMAALTGWIVWERYLSPLFNGGVTA
ncbi:metal-dependent hydrolase [Amycolatopsis sp. NPDC004378]